MQFNTVPQTEKIDYIFHYVYVGMLLSNALILRSYNHSVFGAILLDVYL